MDYEAIEALMREMARPITVANLAHDHENIASEFQSFEYFDTASVFGAMLLDPSLQSNCIRLEALVHLALCRCKDKRRVTKKLCREAFKELGEGNCGRMEDPAEDVFVSIVSTPAGNFKILEGIWESGTFYLQRILDVVETFPDEELFNKLKSRVYALLKLSDYICDRAGLTDYIVGQPSPLSKLQPLQVERAMERKNVVSRVELKKIGLTIDELDLFLLNNDEFDAIEEQEMLSSQLQRYPLIQNEECVSFVLPTATSSAIRMAVFNLLKTNRYLKPFRENLEKSYRDRWKHSGLLGLRNNPPIQFHSIKGQIPFLEFGARIDAGRFVHFYFLMDDFVDMPLSGLMTNRTGTQQDADHLKSAIDRTREFAVNQEGFHSGLTIFLFCGIGRGFTLPPIKTQFGDWFVEFVSVADFDVLNHDDEFDALSLFRVLEGRAKLEGMQVSIYNNNGLLNLLSYVESNDGHLIPPAQVPESFRSGPGNVYVSTNFILEKRKHFWESTDYRRINHVNGGKTLVRKLNDTSVKGREGLATYVTPNFSVEHGIPFAMRTCSRTWWAEVVPIPDQRRESYERWQLLRTWMSKIVPVLNVALADALPDVVQLRVFHESVDYKELVPVTSKQGVEGDIKVNADNNKALCSVHFGPAIDSASANPVNIGERGYVRAICRAFYSLANIDLTKNQLDKLEAAIVPNDDARYLHAFQAREYRDRARGGVLDSVIKFTEADIASVRLGLAFPFEPVVGGRKSIRAKNTCTKLLRGVIGQLESEVCSDLQNYDRKELLILVLQNYETAMIQRSRWLRTARANMALSEDHEATRQHIVDKDLSLNSVLIPSRLLIEFAVASCPESGGRVPGKLELAQLMAKLVSIFKLGEWFNAIGLDWMPPVLKITPLGDILAETDFEKSVLVPFGELGSKDRIKSKTEEYESNYEIREAVDPENKGLDQVFKDAFLSEFGFSIKDFREFLDLVEDYGETTGLAVFEIRRNDFATALSKKANYVDFPKILDAFTLRPRSSYRELPEGYRNKDVDPWRFRRRISLPRLPVVQLDNTEDPVLLVAPGLVRESLAYIIAGYHEGTFDSSHYRTTEMKEWIDFRKGQRGQQFVKNVAKKLLDLGWKVPHQEKELSFLLNKGKDDEFGRLKDYGDVDVFAYREADKRILLIECKHLFYGKTVGEIAIQLNRYRGRTYRDGRKTKKDDLLKQIERVKVLKSRKTELLKHQKLLDDYTIEGWIVFRHPVPMLFSWEKFNETIQIATFHELETLFASRCPKTI